MAHQREDIDVYVNGIPTNFDRIKEELAALRKPISLKFNLEDDPFGGNPLVKRILSASAEPIVMKVSADMSQFNQAISAATQKERIAKIKVSADLTEAEKAVAEFNARIDVSLINAVSKIRGINNSGSRTAQMDEEWRKETEAKRAAAARATAEAAEDERQRKIQEFRQRTKFDQELKNRQAANHEAMLRSTSGFDSSNSSFIPISGIKSISGNADQFRKEILQRVRNSDMSPEDKLAFFKNYKNNRYLKISASDLLGQGLKNYEDTKALNSVKSIKNALINSKVMGTDTTATIPLNPRPADLQGVEELYKLSDNPYKFSGLPNIRSQELPPLTPGNPIKEIQDVWDAAGRRFGYTSNSALAGVPARELRIMRLRPDITDVESKAISAELALRASQRFHDTEFGSYPTSPEGLYAKSVGRMSLDQIAMSDQPIPKSVLQKELHYDEYGNIAGGTPEAFKSGLYNRAVLEESKRRLNADVIAHYEGIQKQKSANRMALFSNPEDFGGFGNLASYIEAKTGKSPTLKPHAFDVRRILQDPHTALSTLLAFRGGVGSGLGGFIGGALGGPGGAVLGSGIGSIADTAIHMFKEGADKIAESGRIFQKSVLGLTAIGQQNTEFLGPNGQPLGIKQQLASQQLRAKSIQLAARARLLPLGIAGQSEATFVQGIASALSQRGFAANPETISKIAEILGGVVQTQRPGLLENSTILLRDLQDVIGGGPNATRVLLSQLIGRNASRGVQKATSAEGVLSALQSAGLGGQVQAAKEANNIEVSFRKISGALDQLATSAGSKYLDTISGSIKEFADTVTSEKGAGGIGKALNGIAENFGSFVSVLTKTGTGIVNVVNFIADASDKINKNTRLPGTDIGAVDVAVGGPLTVLWKALTFGQREEARYNEAGDILTSSRSNLVQKPQSILDAALNTIGGKEEFQKYSQSRSANPLIRKNNIQRALKKLEEEARKLPEKEQNQVFGSSEYNFLSNQLVSATNDVNKFNLSPYIDNTTAGQEVANNIGMVDIKNRLQQAKFRYSKLDENIANAQEIAKKQHDEAISENNKRKKELTEKYNEQLGFADDSKLTQGERNVARANANVYRGQLRALEQSLKDIGSVAEIAARNTENYKLEQEGLNITIAQASKEGMLSKFKAIDLTTDKYKSVNAGLTLGDALEQARMESYHRNYSKLFGEEGINQQILTARRSGNTELVANLEGRRRLLTTQYEQGRHGVAQLEQQQAMALKATNTAYKNLQKALGDEFNKRRELNMQLASSKRALEEFSNQASLRQLNRTLGQTGLIQEYMKSYGSLPSGASPEAIAAVTNPSIGADLRRQQIEEQLAAQGREDENAPLTEEQRQAELQKSIDNNVISLNRLTESINALREVYNSAKARSDSYDQVNNTFAGFGETAPDVVTEEQRRRLEPGQLIKGIGVIDSSHGGEGPRNTKLKNGRLVGGVSNKTGEYSILGPDGKFHVFDSKQDAIDAGYKPPEENKPLDAKALIPHTFGLGNGLGDNKPFIGAGDFIGDNTGIFKEKKENKPLTAPPGLKGKSTKSGTSESTTSSPEETSVEVQKQMLSELKGIETAFYNALRREFS